MFELKKYHGDQVQSLTYEDSEKSFSVGIISPGVHEFGSIRKEVFTVTSGEICCQIENNDTWDCFAKDETFTIPDHKNFKLKVKKTSAYICFYE